MTNGLTIEHQTTTTRFVCSALFLGLMAVFASGCSFIGVQPVHQPELDALRQRTQENEPLAGIRTECTDSRALPILDIVFGGIIAMNAAAVAALPESSLGDLADKQSTLALTGFGTGVLLFASAAYGFYATSDCFSFYRRIEEDTDERSEPSSSASELEQLRARVRRLERENR